MAGSVDKKVKISLILVERFQFSASCMKGCDFPVSEGPTNDEKKRFFVNQLIHSLGEGKRYPAALPRIPTQTVDLSQVFER